MWKIKMSYRVTFIIILMSLGILSGCQFVKPSSSSLNDETNQNHGSSPVKITMSFMTFGEKPDSLEAVQAAINQITIPQINTEVTLLPIGMGNYADQMNLMMTSGEKLDLMSIFYTNFSGYVARNELLPLDDLLKQYGQGITSVISKDYLKTGIVNQKLYGLTTNRDLAAGVGIVMNKEILDKFQIDPTTIRTITDYENVLKWLHQQSPQTVLLLPSGNNGSIMNAYNTCDELSDGFGVLMNWGQQEPLKVVNMVETKEYMDVLKKVRQWYLAGYVYQDTLTVQEASIQLMKSMDAFSYIAPTKPGLAQQESRAIGKEVVVVELLPPFTSTTRVQLFQWGIPITCEHPENAMAFLNLMYTNSDIANLLSWGVEGLDYEVTADGSIDYPQGVDALTTGWGLNSGWQFGNQFITHTWKGEDPQVWEETKAYNASAIRSKALGFTPTAEAYLSELTACLNVRAQYKIALESGLVDPEVVLPEYIEKLKEAGIDQIIEIKQKQLDAWLAQQEKR